MYLRPSRAHFILFSVVMVLRVDQSPLILYAFKIFFTLFPAVSTTLFVPSLPTQFPRKNTDKVTNVIIFTEMNKADTLLCDIVTSENTIHLHDWMVAATNTMFALAEQTVATVIKLTTATVTTVVKLKAGGRCGWRKCQPYNNMSTSIHRSTCQFTVLQHTNSADCSCTRFSQSLYLRDRLELVFVSLTPSGDRTGVMSSIQKLAMDQMLRYSLDGRARAVAMPPILSTKEYRCHVVVVVCTLLCVCVCVCV